MELTVNKIGVIIAYLGSTPEEESLLKDQVAKLKLLNWSEIVIVTSGKIAEDYGADKVLTLGDMEYDKLILEGVKALSSADWVIDINYSDMLDMGNLFNVLSDNYRSDCEDRSILLSNDGNSKIATKDYYFNREPDQSYVAYRINRFLMPGFVVKSITGDSATTIIDKINGMLHTLPLTTSMDEVDNAHERCMKEIYGVINDHILVNPYATDAITSEDEEYEYDDEYEDQDPTEVTDEDSDKDPNEDSEEWSTLEFKGTEECVTEEPSNETIEEYLDKHPVDVSNIPKGSLNSPDDVDLSFIPERFVLPEAVKENLREIIYNGYLYYHYPPVEEPPSIDPTEKTS